MDGSEHLSERIVECKKPVHLKICVVHESRYFYCTSIVYIKEIILFLGGQIFVRSLGGFGGGWLRSKKSFR